MSDVWKTSKTELCPGLWKMEHNLISILLGRTLSFPLTFGFHPWSSTFLPLFAVQLKLEARQLHPGSLPSPLSSAAPPQNLPIAQAQVALSPSLTFDSHSLQKAQFIPCVQCALKHNENIIGAECPPRLWMDSVLLFPKLPKKSYCHAESKGPIFFNQLHKVDFTSIGFSRRWRTITSSLSQTNRKTKPWGTCPTSTVLILYQEPAAPPPARAWAQRDFSSFINSYPWDSLGPPRRHFLIHITGLQKCLLPVKVLVRGRDWRNAETSCLHSLGKHPCQHWSCSGPSSTTQHMMAAKYSTLATRPTATPGGKANLRKTSDHS